MNKEYFTENISTETLAKLIDETLNYEKEKKADKFMASNVLKIVSAVAVVVLVIGAINLLPAFLKNTSNPSGNDNNVNAAASTSTADTSNTINVFIPKDPNKVDLFVPDTVEKSFFENKVLAAITDKKDLDKIKAYYSLVGQNYLLSSDISERERSMLLDIYQKYTNLTGNDIIQMYKDNNIPYVDPSFYANVRFGATRNTLLLEVEWCTADEYEQAIAEPERNSASEYKKSEEYANLSEDEKNKYNNMWEAELKSLEQTINQIKNKTLYRTKSINGRPALGLDNKLGFSISNEDISKYFNSDGYYMFNIYPYYPGFVYCDENGVIQYKSFGTDPNHKYVNNKSEYDYVLEHEIIPYCDDILAKGLITQEFYDIATKKDPLDFYINLYFK